MTHQRSFNFPVALLIGQGTRLRAALRDTTVGPAVLKRLKPGFDTSLDTQLQLVQQGGTDQTTAGGVLIGLTQAEADAYTEMERLMSDARHSATLAFPTGDARLHLEFTVGLADRSHDLDHEIDYANTIVKGCQTYAAQLAEHGWTADDTTALAGYVTTLEGDPALRDTAGDQKKRITSARNSAANDLYKMCLSLQNAARLAYPLTQAGKVPGITEARARFLLGEFPPHNGSASPAPAPEPAPTATK
jgi:hypothetical protein